MRLGICAAALLLPAVSAYAHVGSPDVYLDAKAGPYSLFITVQPPAVIPGIAQIQIRATGTSVRSIECSPLTLTGAGSKLAPIADKLQASKDDPQYFTGALWLMQSGSAQIRAVVHGDAGEGTVSVPLPAIAQRTLSMPAGLGVGLFALMCLLIVGMAGIIGAAAGQAQLPPGVPTNPQRVTRGRIVMAVLLVVLAAAAWLGNSWWKSEAATYSSYVYKPLEMNAAVKGQTLTLRVRDPGWLQFRKTDDFIPDHGHLVHLYVIREPELDRIYHLHPSITGPGAMQLTLPSIPTGRYRLYADVVHEDGFPETMVTTVDFPEIAGRPLSGDDGAASAAPASQVRETTTTFLLPDGYRMIFDKPAALAAKRPESFRFRLVDAAGQAPTDMALYMGMIGHAAFVKTDGSVFAHVHPNGSVAMAAFMLAQPDSTPMPGAGKMAGLPNAIAFPYGFPSAGHYRIFVQMKHGATVETGAFDAFVT